MDEFSERLFPETIADGDLGIMGSRIACAFPCRKTKDGRFSTKIVICNYERLDKFNYSDFECVILDESSILKNFNGAIKNEVTTFLKKVKYRYLFTATPSPNDFIAVHDRMEHHPCQSNISILHASSEEASKARQRRRIISEATA